MMKKIKDYSFIAYIDETGDVGIKPDKSGSSDWFGLSAFIVNVDTDLNLVKIRNDIVERYSTSPRPLSKENKIIHMRKLKSYEARLFVAKSVAEVGASCIMVLSNKKSIFKHNDLYKDTDAYYRYMSRLLLERVTECCVELRNDFKKGNGKVKIIFATRKGMSYNKLKDYLLRLKTSPVVNEKIDKKKLPKINWDIIDIDSVENRRSEDMAGLQFADVLAYSFLKAISKNRYDMTNSSFCRFFKNTMYSKDGRILYKGVFITNIGEIPEDEKPKELMSIFKTKKKKNKKSNFVSNNSNKVNSSNSLFKFEEVAIIKRVPREHKS